MKKVKEVLQIETVVSMNVFNERSNHQGPVRSQNLTIPTYLNRLSLDLKLYKPMHNF